MIHQTSQRISRSRIKITHTRGRCFLLLLGLGAALFAACSGTPNTGQPAGKVATSHASTTKTASPPIFRSPVTYVALGASDAVGVGSNKPGAQGYVPLIAARLPQGSHALNLGVSGIRLHEALSQELPLALSTSPQLITIWLVANDFVDGVSYQSYMSDLTRLLQQLHTQTRARIILANLPDLTRLPAFNKETPAQKAQMLQKINQWDQGIARIAAQNGIALVDLLQHGSEITAHPNYISGDGFHPSAQGYVRLAELFWQVIQHS